MEAPHWNHGGETADRVIAVAGGFILAGTTNVGGNTDVLAIKINESGAIVWMRTYGDGEAEYAHSITATPDDGALISGLKAGYPFVQRIDRTGNLLWARVLTITHPDVGRVNVARSGDFYYLAETGGGNGHNHGGGVEHTGIIVTKINLAGSVLWSRDYHFSQASAVWHLSGTSDGKIVISGSTGTPDTLRAFVLQLDPNGKILWRKRYIR